ncbi:GNAT family N-acetyltransferase [Haloplanus sp. GCM10025708]|uniref:GNAT family N-acetyltransferase n=1 Tax=Haloferacaceae TaxID=1644056 RepID=UPI003616D6AE
MEITTPDAADVNAIADLWVELARDQRAHGSTLRPTANRAAVREEIARHVVTDGIRVAADAELVGFVTFRLEPGRYQQSVTPGVVSNLYVRPAARNDGVGAALLSAAETALADAGADVVTLEAMADNDDARRFYDRHGYSPHRVELRKSLESDTHSKEDG